MTTSPNQKQIPFPLYRKCMKVFKRLRNNHHVPEINQELRRLGLNDRELEIFWNSDIELRLWKEADDRFMNWVNQDHDEGYQSGIDYDNL